VGAVAWSDTFPFGSIPARSLLVELSDTRLGKNVSRGTLLNLLEANPDTLLGKKGEQAVRLQRIGNAVAMMTSNYLEPSGGWAQVDVDAVWDRCHEPLVLSRVMPVRGNALQGRCRHCSAAALTWATKSCREPADGLLTTLWGRFRGKCPEASAEYSPAPLAGSMGQKGSKAGGASDIFGDIAKTLG
jgi:hypothetical protein